MGHAEQGDKAGPASSLGWPDRFLQEHGRRPRILHICNIANYAWVNASIMRRHGVDCVVLDPDFYHVASTPEWLEARIEGEHGDDFYPDWSKARVSGFQRPEWFINGPTPFVLRELAFRESGNAGSRAIFRFLSRFYRTAGAADRGKTAPLRRFMEGRGKPALLMKSLIRRMLLGRGEFEAAMQAPARDFDGPPIPSDALPPRLPEAVLRAALEPFDVIIGYTLGTRIPAALGLPRYVSVELGTIRGLPFEDSDTGRLCAWLYKASPEVFITNVDCLGAADRLEIPPERRTLIPHPFDLQRALAYQPPQSPLKSDVPYFFCPARHHWRSGNSSWLKGNDVLIRGAAEAAGAGRNFRLVMVDWGEETHLSRELIEKLGLGDRITWVKPLSRLALWPVVCGATAVLDQFAAPAFGGAGLEAMALGRRVISRISGADVGQFFSCTPPFLDAATAAEVALQIGRALDDPADEAGVGLSGQEWMRREHGIERQLELQFAAFERLVRRHGAAR